MSFSLSGVITIPKLLELTGMVLYVLKCSTNVKVLLVWGLIPQSLDQYVRLLSL